MERLSFVLAVVVACVGCQRVETPNKFVPVPASSTSVRIIFLHHSTGECIWNGGVPDWFGAYNTKNHVNYAISEQAFPKESPYGWENFPYDYWNIWVKNAGSQRYRDEPTLEFLSSQYDVIAFKHCFPVSSIDADTGVADIESSAKRQENYRLQYAALKEKMKSFPKTQFLLWTGAALTEGETDEDSAKRAKLFFDWVRTDWDEKGDNIFLWDFRELETGGGFYLKPEYASGDSHPNETFSNKVASLFAQRLVDVIEGRGDSGSLTGESVSARPANDLVADRSTVVDHDVRPQDLSQTESKPNTLVWDDAEISTRQDSLWGESATYVEENGSHAIRLGVATAPEEDWGEYGAQRVIHTRRSERDLNLRPYRYLSMRIKADREMELVVTLMTVTTSTGEQDRSRFHFSGYVHATAGDWKTVTLDLERLELSVEDEGTYEKAGRPARPNDLSLIRFATSEKHAKATLLLDDVTFHATLPESLRGTVQGD